MFFTSLTINAGLPGPQVAHRILSFTTEYMELVKRYPAPMISIKGVRAIVSSVLFDPLDENGNLVCNRHGVAVDTPVVRS